jgi:hypothetical protein
VTEPIPGTLLLDTKVIDDPYPFYRLLHTHAPVWEIPDTGLFTVSTFELVPEASARVEDFSSNISYLLYRDATGLPRRLSYGDAGVHALATADPPTHAVRCLRLRCGRCVLYCSTYSRSSSSSCRWFHRSVRSKNSRRTVPTHRSAYAFATGVYGGVRLMVTRGLRGPNTGRARRDATEVHVTSVELDEEPATSTVAHASGKRSSRAAKMALLPCSSSASRRAASG